MYKKRSLSSLCLILYYFQLFCLFFLLYPGDDPRPGAGTHVDFWLSKELKFKEWSAVVAEKRSKTDYFITLTSPPNCIVSNWQLVVEVITNTAKGQEVTSVYIHPTLVYILFNPWCRGKIIELL